MSFPRNGKVYLLWVGQARFVSSVCQTRGEPFHRWEYGNAKDWPLAKGNWEREVMGESRKVQNASGQSRPRQLPIGAGSPCKLPPAFLNEKRWIIDLFQPQPAWLLAAPLPLSPHSHFSGPARPLSHHARTRWLGREQMDKPSCRHGARDA